MKSFCIKSNNKDIINNLLKDFENSNLEDIYFINKKFKNFENIIIHYVGNDLDKFLDLISNILTDSILKFYEPVLIKKLINYNYFYFDELEKKIIEEYCYESFNNDEFYYKNRNKEIFIQVLKYISSNTSMILDGFVHFRLQNYIQILDEMIDYNVKQYVIEKEYNEFISLLKMYINSKEPTCSILHLIYTNEESIILDENKNIVNLNDDIFNAKYLSDISFSSNDYALNALLTLLPKRIELHLIGKKDEFIDTLQLIFNNRLFICTHCDICTTYKILNKAKPVIKDTF